MALRLTFNEFQQAIEKMSDRSMPTDVLKEYLEFDPDSAIPVLRFREDALTDYPPADYDVDEEVYKMHRELEKQESIEWEIYGFVGKKRVVAEGDSWFDLPQLITGRYAIADRIRKNKIFKMKNIARWGHTLQQILKDEEYLEEIDSDRTDYFMICGGGNDLQEGLERGEYIKAYEEGRPVDEYITNTGMQAIEQIGEGHRIILDQVTKKFPNIKIFSHAYDYPRPLVGDGKYIGKYLKKLGIPDELMKPVMSVVIDRLNSVVEDVVINYKSASLLNFRGATDPYTWHDDMHPGDDGFRVLAQKFEEAMYQG